jgi:hypothetical protein
MHKIRIVKYILFWSETDICYRTLSCRRQFRLTLCFCKGCSVTAVVTNTLRAEFGRSTVVIQNLMTAQSGFSFFPSETHLNFIFIKLHISQEYPNFYAHSMSPYSNPFTDLSWSSWFHCSNNNNVRTGEPFWDRVPKLYTDFEDILSRAHGNFQQRNKIFRASIIVINYFIIIITNA